MKAVYFHEHGGPEVLEYGELETPRPGPGEVQVAVRAAALNRLDLFVREGWPGLKLAYPHIPGADAAGVIGAVGDGVSSVVPGYRVVVNGYMYEDPFDENVLAGRDNMARRGGILGEDYTGTCAEVIVVPERNVLRMPGGFPFEEAAAASLVFMTAWHSLITRGGLRPGESVLIVGASGGVNTASIQIAKLAGAEPIYVVGSTDDKLTRAATLGADVLINRHKQDWSKAAYEATGKRGVDVVVDNVGAPTWRSSIRALAPGGRLLVVGATGGPVAETPVNYIFARHLSIIGSTMAPQADFRAVMRLLFEGKLHAVVGRIMPLAAAADAHRLLAEGGVFGKIVLTP
jgi:NADPH:quinone reductase-like Zn-dependent oxidoreductase